MVAIDSITGNGIGVARYVRDPDRRDTAEVAVTVVDDWHGRGVGTLLLEVVGQRARAEGITTFTALMLASNTDMMDVLRGLGPLEIVDRELGCVEVEASVPADGVSLIIARMLKAVARQDLSAPAAPPGLPLRLARLDQDEKRSSVSPRPRAGLRCRISQRRSPAARRR